MDCVQRWLSTLDKRILERGIKMSLYSNTEMNIRVKPIGNGFLVNYTLGMPDDTEWFISDIEGVEIYIKDKLSYFYGKEK